MHAIKLRTYEILFGVRDRDLAASIFSVLILSLIAANVLMGILETETATRVAINTWLGFADAGVSSGRDASVGFFYWFEIISIAIFSLEYMLRLWSCTADPAYRGLFRGRAKMARQPMLIIDLIAILPFYLQVFMPGVDLRFVRALRLFRLFRLFRSTMLARSVDLLGRVIRSRRDELLISFFVVLVAVILAASVMYLVEHDVNESFASVPQAMWWGVITVTTVGYGDVHPITPLGQFIGSFVAFLGVCVFALPVGIIGAGFIDEIDRQKRERELASGTDGDTDGADGSDFARPESDAAEVARWLNRGQARVRRFCDEYGRTTDERNRARAMRFAMLDGWNHDAIAETFGPSLQDATALADSLAEAFIGWAQGALGWSRGDVGRLLAAGNLEDAGASESLASSLFAIVNPALADAERRRLRLALLAILGSTSDAAPQV